MKTIGMVGGTSWVSTVDYYRLLNEYTNQKLGGLNAAKIILYSVNFAEIDLILKTKGLENIYPIIHHAVQSIKNAGADFLLLGANTLHQFAERIENEFGLPIVHIAKETGKTIRKQGIQKVILLGTKYTMEMDFYPQALHDYGIDVIVPDKKDRLYIHDAIINELLNEEFKPSTKEKLLSIINNLSGQAPEGIILGCTELPLIIKPEDTALPLFDTTKIHAKSAVNAAND